MTLTTIQEKWAPYFWKHFKSLFTTIHLIIMLAIPLLYSTSFSLRSASSEWIERRERNTAINQDIERAQTIGSNSDGTTNIEVATTEAFNANVKIIIGHWQMIQFGSGVLIAAALTLPQLQASHPNTPSFYLSPFFSALCGLAALSFTFIYLANKERLMNLTTIVQWSQASALFGIEYSLLWDILSIPAVWFSWCCISFTIAILQLIWDVSASTSNSIPDTSDGSTPEAVKINALGIASCFMLICMAFYHVFITFKAFSKMS